MKKFTATDKAAFKTHHPKKPVEVFKVRSCGVVVFENANIKLCWNFIRVNSLKCKPTSK